MPRLVIAPIKGKGRCVFAAEDIGKGGVIDTNPVLLFPHWQTVEMKPPLQNYPFGWDGDFDCIPLGSLTLANHSEAPNTELKRDFANLLIRLVALRDIETGEEITYHYRVPLWFEPEPPARLNLEGNKNGTSS
jgi:SET domain-containing protein